jgi:transposase-like protein
MGIPLSRVARDMEVSRQTLYKHLRKKKNPDSDKSGPETHQEAGSSKQVHVTTASATLSESA